MGLGVLIGNELLQQPSIVTPLVLFPWSPTIDSVSNVTYHYEVRALEFLREMFGGMFQYQIWTAFLWPGV